MPVDAVIADKHGAEHEAHPGKEHSTSDATAAKESSHKESAASCKADGLSAGDCKANGHNAREMKGAGYGSHECKEAGFSAKECKEGGFNAHECKEAGFNAHECKSAGFNAHECKEAGFNAHECKEAGFNAHQCKEAGFNAHECHSAGFNAHECRSAGFNAHECKEAGFNAHECKGAGFSAHECKEAGFNARECRDAGYNASQCKEAGFEVPDMKGAGFSAQDMYDAGFSANQMRGAGFSYTQIGTAAVNHLFNSILNGTVNLGTPAGAQLMQEAQKLVDSGKVTFSGTHSNRNALGNYIVDDATAQKNIEALKKGLDVYTSEYGHAMGKAVPCDKSLLTGLNSLAAAHSFNIGEIAGGKHTGVSSNHYNCTAVDITNVDGKHVGKDPVADKAFREAAEKAGFHVLGPGDKGHDTHFHLSTEPEGKPHHDIKAEPKAGAGNLKGQLPAAAENAHVTAIDKSAALNRLSIDQVMQHYQSNTGTPVHVDLKSLHLDHVKLSDFDKNGKALVSLFDSNLNDGLIHGTITLERIGNTNEARITYSEEVHGRGGWFNFDMKPWNSAGNVVRNAATLGGKLVYGADPASPGLPSYVGGKPFVIYYDGTVIIGQ